MMLNLRRRKRRGEPEVRESDGQGQGIKEGEDVAVNRGGEHGKCPFQKSRSEASDKAVRVEVITLGGTPASRQVQVETSSRYW